MIRPLLTLALLASPAIGQDAACTDNSRCTVAIPQPVDPVTAQCISDRTRLLAANSAQAALIDDLAARIKAAEVKPVRKHRIKRRHRK